MKLIKKGKVKEVYDAGNDELEFVFTDQISVFDKVIPTMIEHKGETLCRTAAYWFKCAEKVGVRTHFLKLLLPNRMRVKKVDIIADYNKLKGRNRYLIPLELISRYYVSMSLLERIERGDVKPSDLGFRKGYRPKYGDPLPHPFFEVTTKLEPVDTKLSMEEALRIASITKKEWNSLKETVLKIDEHMNSEVKKRGLLHVDGKKEFAFDSERNIMVVDTYGTADEDRFWDMKRYEKGKCVELSKEYVRQWYRKIGYYDKLMKQRERGKKEENIPPLPDNIRDEVSRLYINLYEMLTGEKFR